MTAEQLQKKIEAIDAAVRQGNYKRVIRLIDKFFKETQNG